MAGSLLLMPRLYGQAHLVDTDIPGLFLWAATALAFWKGLHERDGPALAGARRGAPGPGVRREDGGGGRARAPAALAGRRPPAPEPSVRPGARADWIDGLVTSGVMLAAAGPGVPGDPDACSGSSRRPGKRTCSFIDRRATCPGPSWRCPLAVWLLRRLLGRLFPRSPVWGVERPALETWTAILAFAPVVGWLGQPGLVARDPAQAGPLLRAQHRPPRGAARHPDHLLRADLRVQPALAQRLGPDRRSRSRPRILLAAAVGLVWGLRRVRRDRLPLYFLVHFLTLARAPDAATPRRTTACGCSCPRSSSWPPSPAGGRWPAARLLGRVVRVPTALAAAAAAALVLVPGGRRPGPHPPVRALVLQRADRRPARGLAPGFELTYWYDAFNDPTLDEINRKLPADAMLQMPNDLTNPADVPGTADPRGASRRHQAGRIAVGDAERSVPVRLAADPGLQGHGVHPAALRDAALVRARAARSSTACGVATVADPIAVSRAWALQAMLDAADRTRPTRRPRRRGSAAKFFPPPRARFWGDGLREDSHRRSGAGLESADCRSTRRARERPGPARGRPPRSPNTRHRRADAPPPSDCSGVASRSSLDRLLKARPQALVEGVEILIARPEAVVTVMTRYGYTDPETIGGYLDRDLPDPPDVIVENDGPTAGGGRHAADSPGPGGRHREPDARAMEHRTRTVFAGSACRGADAGLLRPSAGRRACPRRHTCSGGPGTARPPGA